jgi:hypothetical protein
MVDNGHGRSKGLSELGLDSAPVHGGSPAVTQRGEGCTGSQSSTSLGHGRSCGDWAMAVNKKWWWRSVQMVLECGEKRRRAGSGALEDGGAFPLYRGRGGGGGGQWLRWRNG